jgi:hypothetical protein
VRRDFADSPLLECGTRLSVDGTELATDAAQESQYPAKQQRRGTMSQEEEPEPKGVFELVEGLTPVDPEALEAFKRAMDKAIPEIAEQEDERRALAAESRRWPLKS